MKCNKCGKNVSQPLELFDGRVVCSECGKDFLAADSTFVITEENQAYFNRSEELYLDWLSRQDSDVEHSSVDKAVELCKASAYLGNPEALARLGYYYDFDYEEANRGENMRTRLAYRCYRAVCMQQIAPKVESNAREIDFIELQKRTAKLLLSMMDKASDEVKKELENDYAVVKNSIASRLCVDIKKRADEVEFNEVKFALDHIAHIVSDQRGTLIGMLKISKSTLVELIQPQNNGVTNLLDLVQKSNKIRMFLVNLTSRGMVSSRDDSVYEVGGSASYLEEVVNELGENIALVYASSLGKHKRYPGKTEKIQSALKKNNYTLVKSLIMNAGKNKKEIAFHDDDLYYCQKFRGAKKSLQDAVEKLINIAIEGGTD